MNTLEVKGLEKKYKDFALQNITLELPKGFICGYVGQNGAGKTTLIKKLLKEVLNVPKTSFTFASSSPL